MQGAHEFARLFSTGQRGRLYFVSGSHARGYTFNIWLLPTSDKIEKMPWCIENSIEIYGVIGGQPGWSERYGWLYRGKWEDDFAEMVQLRKLEIAQNLQKLEQEKAEQYQADKQRVDKLLSTY